MKKLKPKASYIFEVSFEVANKVGGIYRVLESKASEMVNYYGDNYFLIGPYFPEKARGEFKDEIPDKKMKDIFSALEQEGIKCHLGRWMVKGKPRAILVDFQDYLKDTDYIKGELWEKHGIDSLNSDSTFDHPVVWSYAVGKLIERLSEGRKGRGVAHFHEWLSGAGLLYLKERKSKVKTVFTTHATSLGRTLAFNQINFYTILENLNPEEEAYKYNVHSKHQIEKATALSSDTFTTVSEITGLETKHFLEREPDVTLTNGLDLEKFLTFEEIVIKHRLQRRRLREFVASFFFPYYTFDLENTLFYFTIGRNEFKAKGIDVFIKSLGDLNRKLKRSKNSPTIVSFIWIPTGVRNIKQEIIESKEFFNDIRESLEGSFPEIEERILYNLLYEKEFTTKELISENYLFEIEKKMLRFKRKNDNPPLCTHDLNSESDLILDSLKREGLLNREEDKVKVIYYPVYLTGHDGLSNLSYQEGLEACHLGVFPSFYEPWGYTPLEAAALGVSSVTTDLAGFGRYKDEIEKAKNGDGVYVLKRLQREDKDIVKDLTQFMHKFSKLERKERVENKIKAREIAARADWKEFGENYINAHNHALGK